jgi:hypothetical protein
MISDTMINDARQLLKGNKPLNTDIRAAISKLQCALTVREAENTNTDILARYDSYFDDMEKANKKPLPFDEWRATNN